MLITISIFGSSDAAFASNEKAADWVRHNVLEFTKGMPEVMVGALLDATADKDSGIDRDQIPAAPVNSRIWGERSRVATKEKRYQRRPKASE